MSRERISQAEFARQGGWSRQYVNKLVKQGRIRLEGGKIDPVAARRAIDNLAEPSTELRERPTPRPSSGHTTGQSFASPPTPVPAPTDNRKAVDYASARTMREAYRAKMARLDYEERERKLVNAAKVREDAFQVARQVRDGLQAIPGRMADVLSPALDPEVVQQFLEKEIEAVLEALRDQL